MTPGQARRGSVAVVAFSRLSRDSRALRTIGCLAAAGYEVFAVGFGEEPPGATRFVSLPAPQSGWVNRIRMVLRQAPAVLLPQAAGLLHDLAATYRTARVSVCALRPDIVHANDWPALPAALAAQAVCGARVVYDSHEFALEEHAQRPAWRLLMRAHVAAIEASGIARADRVVTVSDGIARALASRYRLGVLPTVIRNVPLWQGQPFRPVGSPRQLLFHGVLKDYRGIETAIAALSRLPGYRLTLRGAVSESYAAALTSAIRAAGVADRVRIEPAVPPDQVVAQANAADIGLFMGPIETRHNRFALPNKLFEYLMAGLGVLVSPGEDMAGLVARYGVGRVAAPSPDGLIAALAGLDDAALNAMKRAALQAARELNWNIEQERLLALYTGLASPAGTSGRFVPAERQAV